MRIENIPECPFCNRGIASSTWLETPDHRVIYNIAPIVPGHSLVIPKHHVTSLLELDGPAVGELFRLARRAIRVLLAEFQGEGFDLSLQDGQAAGQTVPHLHVHLIPRRPADLPEDQDWYEQVLDSGSRPRLTSEELKVMIERLREVVGRYHR